MNFQQALYQLFLFLSLSVSIAYPTVNTNEPIINQELIFQSKQIDHNKIKIIANQLEDLISVCLNLYSSRGEQFMNAVGPLASICDMVKNMPEEAPDIQDVYKILLLFNYSISYLKQYIESNFQDIIEFNPDLTAKEQIDDTDIQNALITFDKQLEQLSKLLEEALHDMSGNILMHVRNYLLKLDHILQTINTNIAVNSNIVNKQDVKNEIMFIRNTLLQIQKETASSINNPEIIRDIFYICKAVIRYLKDAQAHKFRKWANLDIPNELLRSREQSETTLEELYFHVVQTSMELDQLEKDAEKIDLTMLNKTVRFISDYVVDPIQKYDVIPYTLGGIGTIGIGSYLAYYFDEVFFKNPQSRFRQIFGFRDKSTDKSLIITDKDIVRKIYHQANLAGVDLSDVLQKALAMSKVEIPANRSEYFEKEREAQIYDLLAHQAKREINNPIIPISKLDRFIYEHRTGIAATGASLFALSLFAYTSIWKNNHSTWERSIKYWFTKLKGGSFAKTAEKYDFVYPTITFDDIIGLDFEKSLVYPHLKYVKDSERWDAAELTPPTGILLTGPTRSGKTFFAKAICGELHKQNPDKNIRFISIDAHDIQQQSIFAWMAIAKMFAPCVLFIDEIDLLGLQRSQDKTLLADFLQALSGIADKDPKKQVIVIGTTNKPENIDMAMLQSGRFAMEIRFKYPNMQERKEFIKRRLDKFAIDPISFEIDIDKLARETYDRSFEDLKLMIDTALIHVGIKGQIISQDILDWSLDTQLRKIIDIEQKQISKSEKRLLAAHYAGQILSHLLLGMEEKIAKVTIRQITVKVKEESVFDGYYKDAKQSGLEQGGVFTYYDHDTYDIKSQDEMTKKAKTFLGGRVAEKLIMNDRSALFGWKKNAAFNMIKNLVADGIDFKSLSKSGQNMISDQAQEKVKEYEQEMELLLLAHKELLEILVNELQEKQMLTIDQIDHIVQNYYGKSALALAA